MAEKDQVHKLVEEVVAKFSRLDILINNAGVADMAFLEEITQSHFDHLFGTNFLGTVWTTQEAVKHLPQGGRIVNVSSIATTGRMPSLSVYAASKAAVEAFTRVIAAELSQKGITINSIGPGPIRTDLSARMGKEVAAKLGQMPHMGKPGEPSDIANVVAFLASPDSAWITGETIRAACGV